MIHRKENQRPRTWAKKGLSNVGAERVKGCWGPQRLAEKAGFFNGDRSLHKGSQSRGGGGGARHRNTAEALRRRRPVGQET